LNVESGEVVAVMGPNGAGKTTLLRTIAGIVPPIIINGSITMNEDTILDLKRHERAEKGVVLIPDGREIFSGLTVSENLLVASYAPHAKTFREESYEIVYDLFPILEQRYDQMAETLSGGQRQMLCIAMGLMNRPQFFLLDEPSTGLAPIIVLDLFDKIKEICEKYNIGVLLVEQQARLALKLATRGYLLSSGEVVLEGSREELVNNEELSRYYLIGGK
jgi:branched-chain amino acid transport system ATP-binding protein